MEVEAGRRRGAERGVAALAIARRRESVRSREDGAEVRVPMVAARVTVRDRRDRGAESLDREREQEAEEQPRARAQHSCEGTHGCLLANARRREQVDGAPGEIFS
jgi:hypothetical protein